MPHLLLARTKDASDGSIGKTLNRRMDQGLNGQIENLFNEAKALQLRQKKTTTKHKHDTFKDFDQQMTTGKFSNALRCLDETQKGQVLALNDIIKGKSVFQISLDKQPQPSEVSENYTVSNQYENILPYHSSIFDKLNAPSIRKCGMKTRGSHGPWGLDSNEWSRILSNFEQSSADLCKTLATLASLIATSDFGTDEMVAYNACRLIPLDTYPGVRPIGVGEVLRRIIGRSILMSCLSNDLKLLGQSDQFCLGQKCGAEHAIRYTPSRSDASNRRGKCLQQSKS